jgi:thymidine kinase
MHDFKDGKLDIYIGTMFSGKTTRLLSTIALMAELNLKIIYINIDFDNRSTNVFSSHNPFFDNHTDFISKECISKNVTMLKTRELNFDVTPFDVIIVDEAHFFEGIVDFTHKCLEQKKYIIIGALMADFKGNKFGKVLDLITICDNVIRLHAYCSECAKNKIFRTAIYSKRIVKIKKITAIGGADKYIPVCREHYKDE